MPTRSLSRLRAASAGAWLGLALAAASPAQMLHFPEHGATAQDAPALDAGAPEPAPVEIDVSREDGGYAVARPVPDAGSPATGLVPPVLLQDSPAPYPEEARAAKAEGEVQLDLLVGPDGSVQEVALVQGVHPSLDAAAVAAAKKLRFSPARMDGEPVAVRLHFTYRFALPPAPHIAQGPALHTARLRGIVRERGTRRPIPGAHLQTDSGRAADADAQGRFQLDVPAGDILVSASAPGHRPGQYRERLREGESLEVAYALDPLQVNPYETIVRDERPRTEVSRVTLHEQELTDVPGTMGDPFRVVLLLPGVTTLASGLSYPVVRGTEPAATGYYIDGVRVPLLFHVLLGPAVIHPDFLEALEFYPGSPPVEYGRLMGGAIDGRIRRPHDRDLHASAYADLINAGLFAEYPFEPTGTSVTLAGRVSYTGWLIAALANGGGLMPQGSPTVVLDFYDYQGRVEQKIGAGRLRLFAFGSMDIFGARANQASSATMLQSIIFHRVDLRWRQPAFGGELEAGLTAGLDRLGTETGDPKSSLMQLDVDDWTYRGRLGWSGPLRDGLQLQVGADVEARQSKASGAITVPFPNPDGTLGSLKQKFEDPLAQGVFSGAFAQVVWRPTPKWMIVPGLRVDDYHLRPGIDRRALEPRILARYELLESLTLKAGAGLFHQPPTMLLQLPVVDLASVRLGLQAGYQFSAGAEWRVRDGLEIQGEAYFNPRTRSLEVSGLRPEDFAGVPLPQTVADVDRTLAQTATRGRAYGFELLIRHPLGRNWFGWISYTLQRSERWHRFSRLDAAGQPIGTDAGWLPFAFDETHVFNAVVSYRFPGGWTLGGVLHFNTGIAEEGGITSRTMRPYSPPGSMPEWVDVSLDQVDRLPWFPRLDVRVAHSWTFDTFWLEAYLDVLNVTFSREIRSYTYSKDQTSLALTKEPFAIPFFAPALGLKGRY